MRPRYGSRKPTRAPGFDYRLPGPYFITICVQDRQALFGTPLDDGIQRNAAGEMIANVWRTAPAVFPDILLDEFVVLPDHFHAIVTLGTGDVEQNPTLGDVVKWFKSITTVEYARGVADYGWSRFTDRLWQRRSFDHIIRNDSDFDRVRAYIEANPWNWRRDDRDVAEDAAAPHRFDTRSNPTSAKPDRIG